MILGENHEKMSKSKGNVVNPDDIVNEYGADTLRMYEMFMGPLEQSIAWSEDGLSGSRRWLDRVWRMIVDEDGHLNANITTENDGALTKSYHQTVKKVTNDFEGLRFNTAISQLMVFVNDAYKAEKLPLEYIKGFVQLLAPVAPHMGEELWQILGGTDTISFVAWPTYDESQLVENEVEVVLQVNGKVRSKITVPADIAGDELEKLALADEAIQKQITDATVRKVINIKGKLINIVAN